MEIDIAKLRKSLGLSPNQPPSSVAIEQMLTMSLPYQQNWRHKQKQLSPKNGRSRKVLPGVWEHATEDRYMVSINLEGVSGVPWLESVYWGNPISGKQRGLPPVHGYQSTQKDAREYAIKLREKFKIIGMYLNIENNTNSLVGTGHEISISRKQFRKATKMITISMKKYKAICKLAKISMNEI